MLPEVPRQVLHLLPQPRELPDTIGYPFGPYEREDRAAMAESPGVVVIANGRIVEIGEGRGVSAAQVALSWLIGRQGVTSVIIGGRTEAQFKDNLASADLKLSAEERERLDNVSLPWLQYPYWHQRNTASDRLGEADLSLLQPYLKK